MSSLSFFSFSSLAISYSSVFTVSAIASASFLEKPPLVVKDLTSPSLAAFYASVIYFFNFSISVSSFLTSEVGKLSPLLLNSCIRNASYCIEVTVFKTFF
jgi:hypothetical protein